MKRLLIVRHARAVSRKKGLPDFERSLVQRGVKDAGTVAKRLSKSGLMPDLIISSPANRALETAHIFAKRLDYPVEKIMLQQPVYDADLAAPLMELLRGCDNELSTVMICGHDPSISDLAGYLIPGFDRKMDKGAVVGVEFAIDTWQQLTGQCGQLTVMDYPMSKAEKSRIKQDAREHLVENLVGRITEVLAEVDGDRVGKMQAVIRKSSERIVDKFFDRVGGKRLILRYGALDTVRNREESSQQTESAQ